MSGKGESASKQDSTLAPPVLGEKWKRIGQFILANKYNATGIVVTSDGKIAVCDGLLKLNVYSKSGDVLHTIDDGWMGGLGDVSVTSTNGYVIPKAEDCCSLYNSDFKLVSEFQTYNANKKPYVARAVAVDKNGCIIVGTCDAISIHNANGSLKSSFALPFCPFSVAVTSHEEIVVAGNNSNLQLFDYSGKCIQTLDPPPEVKRCSTIDPPPEMSAWSPWRVCCSKTDEVFVVNVGDPIAIFKYAAGRVYMGCVTTEVNNPWAVALSYNDQELYVTMVTKTCEKVVRIFKRS